MMLKSKNNNNKKDSGKSIASTSFPRSQLIIALSIVFILYLALLFSLIYSLYIKEIVGSILIGAVIIITIPIFWKASNPIKPYCIYEKGLEIPEYFRPKEAKDKGFIYYSNITSIFKTPIYKPSKRYPNPPEQFILEVQGGLKYGINRNVEDQIIPQLKKIIGEERWKQLHKDN